MPQRYAAIVLTLVFVTTPAFAKRTCLQVLTGKPSTATNPPAGEIMAAQEWLRAEGAAFGYGSVLYQDNKDFRDFVAENQQDPATFEPETWFDWAARFTVQQWESWKKITPQQRQMARSLELSKIRPHANEKGQVIDLNVDIASLSARNLARMQSRLAEMYPIPEAKDPRFTTMSQQLDFLYLHNRVVTAGGDEPVMSPRELKRLFLDEPSFFSSLMDTSASAAFGMRALNSGLNKPHTFGQLVTTDQQSLRPEVADREGFVLPDFSDALALMSFFDVWDPQANVSLFRASRMRISESVETYEDFRGYVTVENERQVFGENSVSESLAVLRARLINYVLTPEDAKTLLRDAFYRWLCYLDQNDRDKLKSVIQDWNREGAAPTTIATGLLPWLGMGSGLQVRVPMGVSPAEYYLIRAEQPARIGHGSRFSPSSRSWPARPPPP